ncbi:unnamed protein product [Sympodiomycopsis kandeliae]
MPYYLHSSPSRIIYTSDLEYATKPNEPTPVYAGKSVVDGRTARELMRQKLHIGTTMCERWIDNLSPERRAKNLENYMRQPASTSRGVGLFDSWVRNLRSPIHVSSRKIRKLAKQCVTDLKGSAIVLPQKELLEALDWQNEETLQILLARFPVAAANAFLRGQHPSAELRREDHHIVFGDDLPAAIAATTGMPDFYSAHCKLLIEVKVGTQSLWRRQENEDDIHWTKKDTADGFDVVLVREGVVDNKWHGETGDRATQHPEETDEEKRDRLRLEQRERAMLKTSLQSWDRADT